MGCTEWSGNRHGAFLGTTGSESSHEHQEDVANHGTPRHSCLLSVCKATGGKEGRKGEAGPEQAEAVLGTGR